MNKYVFQHQTKPLSLGDVYESQEFKDTIQENACFFIQRAKLLVLPRFYSNRPERVVIFCDLEGNFAIWKFEAVDGFPVSLGFIKLAAETLATRGKAMRMTPVVL